MVLATLSTRFLIVKSIYNLPSSLYESFEINDASLAGAKVRFTFVKLLFTPDAIYYKQKKTSNNERILIKKDCPILQ